MSTTKLHGHYFMPAEWETHEATWLAWPHEESDWPGKFAPIRWVYGEIARHLAEVERVRLLVPDKASQAEARRVFKLAGVNLAAVDFYVCPTDRSWTRDFAPIFVRDAAQRLTVTNWKFNGWAKYPDWHCDNAVPTFTARKLKLPLVDLEHVVLEGGSIDVNGAGLMLTTEECLLSPMQARNPGLAREDLEAIFARHLGIRKVLWLNRGIAGDDTHGHVDDLARFTHARTVVIVVEPDRGDENHEPLKENLARLRRMTDLRGRPLRIATLPMPRPVMFGGQRLPASYANFYIANGIVLVPVFNDPADREALNTIAELFPRRRVIPIYCRDFVLGLGTLHCCTQQQPAARA
ncbi:MAG: agmatine deiminase family protein [Acidobacteria bacterium]|nr:agmatine deiminase family protein [Acidobacteriota bacterium]